MTKQPLRSYPPFALGQRPAYRCIIPLMLLILIAMGLPARSGAQQTCQPDGDVDQDGSVTIADALLAFQQVLSSGQLSACQLSIADVFPIPTTPDGDVTVSDVSCIFQKALSLPSCLDTPNEPPIVNAGRDQSVDAGTVVILSGVASDPDGHIVNYLWEQTGGATVVISNADQASASFVAPEAGTSVALTFRLTVTDDDGATASDDTTVYSGGNTDERGNGISTTGDNQILVELLPEDTTAPNPFDLNGLTLVFTPDGQGGYSRDVRSLAWEEDIGAAVADGAVIALESFGFVFAGQRWDAFHVSRHGLVTFGGPSAYKYWDSENRFETMRSIGGNFVNAPTISPLYKPMLGGRNDRHGATQHVARWPDRVVVTWITSEPDYYVHGVPPENPDRFQAVLGADGSIRFNYADVTLGDGIVGLFPDEEISKGDLIARIIDDMNPDLPGHLDLLEVAIYESNTGVLDTGGVIVELTMREPLPDPGDSPLWAYHLSFDTDQPFWTHPDAADRDFLWEILVNADGDYVAHGPGVQGVLARDATNRIALHGYFGELRSLSATLLAISTVQGEWVIRDWATPALMEIPTESGTVIDLSQSDSRFTNWHSEVFHYRSILDLTEIGCRVVAALGDRFDFFVFHSEFRLDSQESGAPWHQYGGDTSITGIGDVFRRDAPCGEGRLLGRWELPVWIESNSVWNDGARYYDERTGFERGLLLFAHELTHVWTAFASFVNRDGEREPLFGGYCQCHWRWDLHQPAAFPWHADDPGARSLMGQKGTYWRDNGNGTFTPLDGYWSGGHSWLDLYMMGLADAHEVPDMFILRNLREVNEGEWWGPHTGEKEIVSINQIIAAEGPREPRAAHSQKVFNAGFVYLLEPGQRPSGDLLDLHRRYRDQVQEHWRHITGGRSQITTNVHE